MFDVICSGTGPSFFSMLGVCRALYDLKVPIENLACTSGSSIPLGLVFAAGMDWFNAYNAMIDLDFRSMISLRPWRGGIYDTTKIERWIDKQTDGLKLKDIKIKSFVMNAVDIKKKRMHVLSNITEPEMTLGKAIRMTISIPGIFAPVNYKNKWFVDGGVYENAQVEAFPDSGNKKIIFLEQDNSTERLEEIWEKEGERNPRPNIFAIALNSISCLMKSRLDRDISDPPPNSTVIPIRIRDIGKLSPTKPEKNVLFLAGFAQAAVALQKII